MHGLAGLGSARPMPPAHRCASLLNSPRRVSSRRIATRLCSPQRNSTKSPRRKTGASLCGSRLSYLRQSGPHRAVNLGGGIGLQGRSDMAVNVHCDADTRMSEHFTHNLCMGVRAEEMTGEAVAQVMKPDAWQAASGDEIAKCFGDPYRFHL